MEQNVQKFQYIHKRASEQQLKDGDHPGFQRMTEEELKEYSYDYSFSNVYPYFWEPP